MKCFRHPEQDAVGTCKSCCKGICRDCTAEQPKGLACRNSCEEDVRALTQLLESSMRISPLGTKVWLGHRTNMLWTAAACAAVGILFVVLGAFHDPPLAIVVALGAVLALWGVVQGIQALRLRAVDLGRPRA